MDFIKHKQNKLKLTLIDYKLENMWQSHLLINQLRQQLYKFFPKGLYDPQDLEHQVLFRLTTFDPEYITDNTISDIVEEQYFIMQHRLNNSRYDLEYIFRGISGKYHDLNVNQRLTLHNINNQIIAKNDHCTFEIDFKVLQDEKIISLFTNDLHYIHKDRQRGDTFALYFKGDDIPWAIETTEPSIISKEYKRNTLLAHGIDPNKAIELTRFYTLPGAPLNAISLMDRLVSEYYKPKGIEALFTTTMPMYSKTKGSTIAGGINKPLLVKDLQHKFIPQTIHNKTYYQHVISSSDFENSKGEFITTHPKFPTMMVVEVYKCINKPSLPPIQALIENPSKVIYIKNREVKIEKEIKFQILDINTILSKLSQMKNIHFLKTVYIRDIIFGTANNHKIRLRTENDFSTHALVEAIYKYRINDEKHIKTEVEDIIYRGENIDDAICEIQKQGDFKEENSYEKMRVIFHHDKTEITIDIYPYGVWMEIEGIPEDIWSISSSLGFTKNDAILLNADELYLEWNKKLGLREFYDVRFGLNGKK